jgi:quercetin dioxygenase-like cupin family protein
MSTDYRIYGDEPMLVTLAEATRFLWGDEASGQVSDLIYGRGDRISGFVYLLGPGHWFGSSETWKPLYDQHRLYFVVQGTLAIHDPESGEVAVAGPGEGVTWRGLRYHYGYNVGTDEVIVLDWFAPAERPPDAAEVEYSPQKRPVENIVGGRYELLGTWPDAHADELAKREREGGMLTVGPSNALHLIQGQKPPQLVSILCSSADLTAGTFSVRGGTHTEPERHPGDEVVFALSGRLNVHLPELGAWHELNRLDCLYLPEGTLHEYWSYGAESADAMFVVAPGYR